MLDQVIVNKTSSMVNDVKKLITVLRSDIFKILQFFVVIS